MCIGLHVKYLLFLSECNETLIFSTFSKTPEISNVVNIIYDLFVPICNTKHENKSWIYFQWELRCSVRTDWRRELTKIIVDLRNFAKLPKSLILLSGIEPGLRGRPARDLCHMPMVFTSSTVYQALVSHLCPWKSGRHSKHINEKYFRKKYGNR